MSDYNSNRQRGHSAYVPQQQQQQQQQQNYAPSQHQYGQQQQNFAYAQQHAQPHEYYGSRGQPQQQQYQGHQQFRAAPPQLQQNNMQYGVPQQQQQMLPPPPQYYQPQQWEQQFEEEEDFDDDIHEFMDEASMYVRPTNALTADNSSNAQGAAIKHEEVKKVDTNGPGTKTTAMTCLQIKQTVVPVKNKIYIVLRVQSTPRIEESRDPNSTPALRVVAGDCSGHVFVEYQEWQMPPRGIHVGDYIRVYGTSRHEDSGQERPANKRHVLCALKVEHVEDFNEITYHMLRVIRESLPTKLVSSSASAEFPAQEQSFQAMASSSFFQRGSNGC